MLAVLLGVTVTGSPVRAHGIQLTVPAGWHRVQAASDRPVTDPLTQLVVGTNGVRAHRSQCQIAAYRVPPAGAVVVVIAWRHGEASPHDVGLARLTSVHKPSFECFAGRGTAAAVTLRGRLYQVNVMVGDRASEGLIAEALAVGRSLVATR